jgi:hypothetical protein
MKALHQTYWNRVWKGVRSQPLQLVEKVVGGSLAFHGIDVKVIEDGERKCSLGILDSGRIQSHPE